MKKISTLALVTCGLLAGSIPSTVAQTTDKIEAQPPMKAYVVSNAHFDTQWNWDVQTSIKKGLIQTLEQNFWLMDHYPHYVFNFEGGIKYQWMKEYYPLHYARLKEYIKAGRWYPAGASWDATDPIAPSTESAFRNILLGQEWYKREFGMKSDDIFLPDSFGFGYAMPTIAAHSGLIGFSTNKLGWRYVNPKYPFQIGIWEGVDGSRIMAAMSGARYDQDFWEEDLSNSKMLQERIAESGLGITYRYYGVGDEGGAPSVFSAEAVEAGINGSGPVKIISAHSAQMYKDYLPLSAHPELPIYKGELLLDSHGPGCYTSHGEMKLLNRRNEQLADAAEHAAVMADWFGGFAYPAETLTEAWRRVIWHQFHDDITGTSIPRSYEFSWNDELLSQTQFRDVIWNATGAVSAALDTRTEGTPVIVYNPTAYERQNIATAEIPMSRLSSVTVVGPDGKSVPSEVVSYHNGKAQISFVAHTAPVSYTVYSVQTGKNPSESTQQSNENSIENSIYKVSLNEAGDIASIIDKRQNRELVESGKAIRLALFTNNPSPGFPAWEVFWSTLKQEPVSITEEVKISRQSTPLKEVLRIEKRYGTSTIAQEVTLYTRSTTDRIDVTTELDWSTKNCFLKAEFPLTVSNPEATYDIGLGVVKRPNNHEAGFEVYAQHWADLSEPNNAYGVSILNDSKYGWDKPSDNTLRLSLLHVPSLEARSMRWWYQAVQDFGHHKFTYSIIGHEGDYLKAEIIRKAEELNQPLMTFTTPKHSGALGKSFSFVRSSTPQVAIKMMKKAEEGEWYALRVYETEGRSVTDAAITFAGEIAEAKEANGIEEVIGTAKFRGNQLLVTTEAYRPKTYLVRLKKPTVQLAAPTSTPVEIPYSHIGISPDGYYTTLYDSDGYFDAANNSYAAELLPRKLNSQGIEYQTGIPGIKNTLRCQGEKITLPQGTGHTKLYILCAATDRDRRATFTVDGTPHTFDVPYYSGYYGQWEWIGFSQGYIRKADVAHIGTHRHNLNNGNEPYVFTYIYRMTIDLPKGAKELTLPDDSYIGVIAVSLGDDPTQGVAPAWEMRSLPRESYFPTFATLDPNNLLAGRPIIRATNSRQAPDDSHAERALDGESGTAWRDLFDDPTGSPKFLEIDLGEERTFNVWRVEHDGTTPESITRDFKLMTKDDPNLRATWTTVDEVRDNTSAVTERRLTTPITTRYLRLEVTRGTLNGNKEVVIREFSAYMQP